MTPRAGWHLLIVPLVLACRSTGGPSRVPAGPAEAQIVVFEGMCDASGAVPLDDRLFAVADDEDNVNPEGFFTPERRARILVLSDDGSQLIEGEACKTLADAGRKRFRGLWLDLAR